MAITSTSAPSSSTSRQGGSYTKVTVRDGLTISINDHIYLSSPWLPGGGEPYLIGRVVDFVTASSARSGAAHLASSSGTLQVRVNVFQRQRDLSHKPTSDTRLLLATMHTDLFALENVRGLCEVRHRELIGDAPQISAWKKKDDHFYYYQLYDRYIHRYYDVVPTYKLRNAPAEVLDVLRKRYSFVIAEGGMTADLCDAVRGCAVCHQWASGTESVRCDTCKKFFHMLCLNPPLAAKPAKGYSWTCAPCSKRHEQSVAMEMGAGPGSTNPTTSGTPTASHDSNAGTLDPTVDISQDSVSAIKARTASSLRGGRPRTTSRRPPGEAASAAATPEGTPAPDKTIDDVRGVRCYERWPYRYFGQHTVATDVLDPHDSIYPRATTRLGQKFQANLVTWEQQKEMGLGVALGVDADQINAEETPVALTRKPRAKQKRGVTARKEDKPPLPATQGQPTPEGTPALTTAALPDLDAVTAAVRDSTTPALVAPVREFERGGDESVEVICDVSSSPDEVREVRINYLDAYMATAAYHFRPHPSYNVDFIDHAVKVYNDKQYEPIVALQEVSKSNSDDLRIMHWTEKERRAFEQAIKDAGAEMRQLKKAIPTKTPAEIVRYFAIWKNARLQDQHATELASSQNSSGNGSSQGAADGEQSSSQPAANTRAVSPALSVWDGPTVKASPNVSCKVCGTTTSSKWYRGAFVWPNRNMCSVCGIYWRKYAAEPPVNTELIATNPRKHPLPAEEHAAVSGPPSKAAKFSKTATAGAGMTSSSTAAAAAAVAAAAKAALAPAAPVKPDPIRCVMCKRLEPKKKLQQCLHCSLSVHQGCFGLSDEEAASDKWVCDPCSNEQSLDNALHPHCILCPSPIRPQNTTACNAAGANGKSSSSTGAASGAAFSRVGRGRPSAVSGSKADPVAASVGEPLTALDAVKPTECNNWAHLICAAWIPEVMVTDGVAMKPVEGAGYLPFWRYMSECEICRMTAGACIQCSEPLCKRTFHVSCALAQNTGSLRFEINPVKLSRRDSVTTASFKSETGHWTCLAFCKGHKDSFKDKPLTYDFFETDPKTGLTALQVYMRTHKSVNPASLSSSSQGTSAAAVSNGHGGHGDQMHALLRRAKRFDTVLSEVQQEARRGPSESHRRAQTTKTPPAPPSISIGRKTATPSPRTGSKSGAAGSPKATNNGGEGEEEVQRGNAKAASAKPEGTKHCIRCDIRFSPFWWPVEAGRGIEKIHGGIGTVIAESGALSCNLCRPVVFPAPE